MSTIEAKQDISQIKMYFSQGKNRNLISIPDCDTCAVTHKTLLCANQTTKTRINKEKQFFSYNKGEYLFKAHQSANGFYFIKKGTIRTFVLTDAGNQQTLALKGPSDWLGFQDCMAYDVFNFSAIALEKTEVCFINQDLIADLVRSDESFRKEIFYQIAQDWKETQNQVISLGTKQAHSRIGEVLLILDKTQGVRGRVDLFIKREDLSSMLGMKVETLVRALNDLKSRGYIVVKKYQIDILNRKALFDLSIK